ncbi:hypothetical protein MKW98_003724 [Papaver atlanticum]|uniref:Retrovirus-related Pol polyprotein from transposon TNT 1-94-like beta-barrel domain-containing protein n=1 Tax=Papaver atlanticum TaxID=357466 RepID=A0AAD4XFF6_9MAGN|nr:hypothetical protein MKW98_003724 [Papaver atlanticum]
MRLQKDECAWCRDFGNWAKDFPKRKARERDNSKTEVNIAKGNEESDDASDFSLTVTPSACAITDGTWVLDTGATYHICPYRDLFSSFEELDGEIWILEFSDDDDLDVVPQQKKTRYEGEWLHNNMIQDHIRASCSW